jgi:hypothetical protein
MKRNYLQNVAKKVIASIFALALPFYSLNSKADDNIYSAHAVSSERGSYGKVGLDYFPRGSNNTSYLGAYANLGKAVGGSVGLVVREDAHGFEGFGFNVSGDKYDKDSLFSVGLERLGSKSQTFLNGYFGKLAERSVSGVDAGVLRDLVRKDNVTLSGILGTYSFKAEDNSSSGARIGGRAYSSNNSGYVGSTSAGSSILNLSYSPNN